jgi:hypothetical protein
MLHSHSGSFHIDDVVEATIDRLKDVASYKVETKAPAAPIPMEISTPQAEAMAVVSISAEPPTAAGEQETLAQESAATVIPTLPAATNIPYLKQAGETEPGAPAESASPVPVSAESPAAARLAELPASPPAAQPDFEEENLVDDDARKPRKRGRPPGIQVNGAKLKQFRGGYSQEDFADKLGVGVSTYQEAEMGREISEPKVRQIVNRINELFERLVTSFEDLTTWETRNNPNNNFSGYFGLRHQPNHFMLAPWHANVGARNRP